MKIKHIVFLPLFVLGCIKNIDTIVLKNKMAEETRREISQLILPYCNTDAIETGGFVIDEGRLKFEEVESRYVILYKKLSMYHKLLQDKTIDNYNDAIENIKKYLVIDLNNFLQSIEPDLLCYQNAYICYIKNTGKKLVKNLTNNKHDEKVINKFKENLEKLMKSSYLGKNKYDKDYIAKFHTHTNDTPPSDWDENVTKNRNTPEFVISFDKDICKKFTLYYADMGISYFIEEYNM